MSPHRPRAPRRCLYGCAGDARLYPQGWRCVEHAPPLPPRPPAGTTLAELLAVAAAERAATQDRRRAAVEARRLALEGR